MLSLSHLFRCEVLCYSQNRYEHYNIEGLYFTIMHPISTGCTCIRLDIPFALHNNTSKFKSVKADIEIDMNAPLCNWT